MNNTLIKSLIEAATGYDTVSGPYVETYFDKHKFVELIIAECCSAINKEIDEQHKANVISNFGGLNQARFKILEHFGLKK